MQLNLEQHEFEFAGPLKWGFFSMNILEKVLEICDNMEEHFFLSLTLRIQFVLDVT